jgi:hypothetical protein
MLQVFPGANLINPYSPHLVLQEFLTIQLPLVSNPTARTAWFVFNPQLEKIPPLYNAQLLASTEIETGYLLKAAYTPTLVPAIGDFPLIL